MIDPAQRNVNYTRDIVRAQEAMRFLQNVRYPAWKEDLVVEAERAGAHDKVVYTLSMLPDLEFLNPDEVSDELSQI